MMASVCARAGAHVCVCADHQPSAACYVHVGRGARDPGLAVLGVDLRVGRVASVYVDLAVVV